MEFFGSALVTPRWKLLYFSTDDEGRLFDRLADPKEHNDLFQSKAHEAVRNGLLKALLRWRSRQDVLSQMR